MFLDNLQFFYNSGTGNTYLIVKEMVRVFKKNDINVETYRIESTNLNKIDKNTVIGLAFPVAIQSTYKFVWDFVNKLPNTKDTPIFMVDTMMLFSGAIIGPLKKVLTKKGYNCIGAKEIIMPNNFFRKNVNTKKDKVIIDKGIIQAKLYAQALLKGDTKWRRIPFLSVGLYHLCSNKFVMNQVSNMYGNKITIDKNKCIQCGLCTKLCPVNNISDDKFPIWSNKCQLCMRCLSYCPTNAVIIPKKYFKQYRTIEAKEHLSNVK